MKWKHPRKVIRIVPSVGARKLDQIISDLEAGEANTDWRFTVLLEDLKEARSSIGHHETNVGVTCANPLCKAKWQSWDKKCFYCDSKHFTKGESK